MMLLLLLLLLACAPHAAAAPDLSGDVVRSEYLLLTRPPAAALFDCDAWEGGGDALHVTLKLMNAAASVGGEGGYRCDVEVDGAVVSDV